MSFIDKLKMLWDCRELFLRGLGVSLLIAVGAVVLGFFIGIIVAIVRISPKNNWFIKVLDKIAGVYITVIRGTPMLVQLLIMSNVILASLEYFDTNIIVPILAFGINSGAYMAEIIRSGIESIDKGQMEAGRSLGLSWVVTMIRVVVPQAIKVVVPTIFNEIIIMIKETSVVSYILVMINGKQVRDLLGVADKQGLYTGFYMEFILTAAILYLGVVMLLTLVQKMIERRFKKNER